MKSTLLKAVDVAGLTFLMPVIRLAYRDEPRKQLGEIGRMILVPLIAIAIFIGLWSVVASQISTRSGQLPNPSETASAADAIWTFHNREGIKEEAFITDSATSAARIDAVEARLEKLEAAEPKVRKLIETKQAEYDAAVDRMTERIAQDRRMVRVVEKEALFAEREAKLKAYAASLEAGDREGKQKLLTMLTDLSAAQDAFADELRSTNEAVADDYEASTAALKEAKRIETSMAEERQHLRKLKDVLSRGRVAQLESQTSRLTNLKADYLAADGPDSFKKAERIVAQMERIENVSASEYAKPYTLPMQVLRSVLCVFVGFLIGVLIAVPIGVLCGLSPTFMAAMTPFIALFKPVSPIVWLPIALIVVSSFIPDPDQHWLTTSLAELPLIGWMKINPAFIASAITVALCSLWATMTNTALGVASISEDHMNVARVLRLGFWERLFKIVIPSALPLIFAGMRISLGVGWMVLIAAELLASSEGIGKFVWDQFNNGASDSFAKMVVVVFVVGAIGLLLDRIMIVLQRAVSFDGAPAAI